MVNGQPGKGDEKKIMIRKVPVLLLIACALTACIHMAAEVATNPFRRSEERTPEVRTPTIAEQNAAWCAANDCSGEPLRPVNVLMDTHAHLSMGPGMGRFFKGKPWDLEHEPRWSDRFSEKMGVEAMRKSGYGLVVVSLYTNVFAIWPGDAYEAIDEEIRQTHELVRRYPDMFTIATTAEQARRAIAAGKMALVLHLEGAEWVMRSEQDIAYLYRAGVRATNPVHLYDSWIGAADLQAGNRFFLNPPGFGNSYRVNGRRENRKGLTPTGKEFMRTLKDYGILIDISHLSRQSLRDLHAMPELEGLPFFNSHMPDLDTTTYSERGVDDEAFGILRSRKGLLGLVPTAHSPERMDRFPGLCPGTVETYAAIYAEAVQRAGDMPIAMASDFNGGIGHLKPTHGPEGCHAETEGTTAFEKNGMADASSLPATIEWMRSRGVNVQPLYDSAERYLQMWERVEAAKRL